MKKRTLSILLALVFLLSVFMFCTTAFAAENSADGLNAVLTTDKTDYVGGDTIGVTLDVTNTSIYVDNIRTELIIPEGVELVEGLLKSDAVAIAAGQTVSYTYGLAVPVVEIPTTQAPTTQAPTTVAPTTQPGGGEDTPPETRDLSAAIYGMLAIASLAGLIALTFGAKMLKQRWFVLILCAGLLLGVVAPVAANAAVTEKTFEVVEAITIDGEAAEVKAIVTYDLDDGELLASEVEFKKDGVSLYSLVPEKGWYTASNKGIVVDGVAASNTSRPEVTASYIDMLFGCVSTKSGNFVKGEFDNEKIISDDAEKELLVGLTDDVASRKALDHINYNEWIIAEIDGKVVVTGWFDNATAAAARYLYNLVKDQDNVTLSLPITGTVDGFVTDIPAPTVGTFDGGLDASEGTLVLSYSDMDEEKFLAYAKDLEDAGFELYAENKILNYGERYNLFRTYTKGESAVHISFLPDDFTHADPATLSANEQAYFSRSFRASGCEMRIVTDSTEHLFNNDAANVYTDAGITPKVSLVNLYNQVADGNNNAECLIYTLADGSFIVVDGGFTQDADHVYRALKELNEREDGKIVVAAWIMSHHHGDHIGAFKAMAEKEYAKEIFIEQFVYNPTAPNYFWRQMNAPYNYTGDFSYSVYNDAYISGLLAKFGDGNTKIVNPHMGEVMQIRNADVEFLYTGDEDLYPIHMDNTNDSSLVFTVNFDMGTETTEDDTRVLMMNDACCDSAYAVLHPLFSRVMDCDIVQVGHHGLGGPSTATYRMMAPTVAIWCSTESTAVKNNWFVPKTNDDGTLAGGTVGGSAGFLVYRALDDTNPPADLVLMAEHYVQTLELPFKKGDVIDKRILTDYYTGLYATEEVDVAFLPAFRFQGQFNSKYEQILAELEGYDADVMILTQIDQLCTAYNNTDVIGKLMEDLDFTYYAYAPVWNANKDFSGNLETGEGTMGHLILSRYPITSAESVVLVDGNTTAWATPEGRGFCHAVLDVDGLSLDIYATHLSNDSIDGFNAALAGEHKPTGDYWMIVGNCNQAAYEDSVKKVAPVAGNLNGGNFEVYGDANIEFTNVKVHDNWKTMINQNMDQTYTYTAVLSRYLASDNVVKPTPETDMMFWWINSYGGSKANMDTILGELKYVHPEIAVLAVVDNTNVAIGTPEYIAEQSGYKYSYYVKSWTRTEKSERGHMILSDIELKDPERIVLIEDGGAASTPEGRAFGRVVMTIDGEEVDVYFGATDSSNGMVTQLEAIVKANAEATGRQFIVAGYKFGVVGKTYAGKNVKNNMLDPGYSIILSEGNLKTAKFSVRPKTELGIAAAGISDQFWVKFGEPTMEDLPLENRVMGQLVNMIKSPAEFNALIEEIREQNPAIVGLVSLHTRSSGYVPEDFVEALGYPYSYYIADGRGTENRGNLILSKYPLTFVESYQEADKDLFSYLTTEVDGRGLDLYIGYDIANGNVASFVQENAAASGNDFVVFGHGNFQVVADGSTWGGKTVTMRNDSTMAVIMSSEKVDITEAKVVTKAGALNIAGITNAMVMDFAPKAQSTTVMAWWLNGWRNQTEVDAMIRQIKEANVDLAVVVSGGNFRMGDMTVEKFVELTGYKYWYYEHVADPNNNGTSRGNLMLSKTPITYVDHTLYNNLKFSHLTATINYRDIDLFMGYDIAPAAVEGYVKEIVDKSGNDFIIFGHNFSNVGGTYAGREVVKQAAGTTALVVSQVNQTVLNSGTVAKDPVALSWAGHGDQAHMEIEVTPKPMTNVMAWWLNGWQKEADVVAMIDEIKAQDQDIAVIISAGNFRYADITVEQFVEMTGYKYWYYETVVTNENGTVRGNLMLSKTELKYNSYLDVNGLKFSYLNTVINGTELDLFMGYDVAPDGVENYVKEMSEASGNDFLVCAFNFSELKGDTYAGQKVVCAKEPTGVYIVASGKNQTVVETKVVPKPAALSWAGFLDEVHMVLDIGTATVEEPEEPEVPEETEGTEVSLLEWWINNPTTSDLEKIKTEVKSRNADIVALISITKTSAPDLDPAAYAKEFGYPYSYFVQVTDAGRGNILLSKYPIEFVEQHSEVRSNGTTIDIINYLKVDVNGTKLDVYIGYDCVPAGFQNYIKANAEKTGSDFLLMMKSGWTLSDPYAGKDIVASDYSTSKGNNLIAVSLDSLEVVEDLVNSDITVDITTAAVLKYVVTGKIRVK